MWLSAHRQPKPFRGSPPTSLTKVDFRADSFKEKRRIQSFSVPSLNYISNRFTKPDTSAFRIDPRCLPNSIGDIMLLLVFLPDLFGFVRIGLCPVWTFHRQILLSPFFLSFPNDPSSGFLIPHSGTQRGVTEKCSINRNPLQTHKHNHLRQTSIHLNTRGLY